MTLGTAGAKQYSFAGQAPYIAKQFQRFSFLNIDVVDNGLKLIGKFYDSLDANAKDNFTIILLLGRSSSGRGELHEATDISKVYSIPLQGSLRVSMGKMK